MRSALFACRGVSWPPPLGRRKSGRGKTGRRTHACFSEDAFGLRRCCRLPSARSPLRLRRPPAGKFGKRARTAKTNAHGWRPPRARAWFRRTRAVAATQALRREDSAGLSSVPCSRTPGKGIAAKSSPSRGQALAAGSPEIDARTQDAAKIRKTPGWRFRDDGSARPGAEAQAEARRFSRRAAAPKRGPPFAGHGGPRRRTSGAACRAERAGARLRELRRRVRGAGRGRKAVSLPGRGSA